MEGYLFRIINSAENEAFFETHRELASESYAGLDFRFGEGNWAPDFVAVRVYEDQSITIILVEVEAEAVAARVSARKYLAEAPAPLLKAFDSYLARVIKTCRATADRREKAFRGLRHSLRQSKNIQLYAACAVSGEKKFVETHPFLYQPERNANLPLHETTNNETPRASLLPLGKARLNAKELNWLFGTIAILDAVVRGADASSATYRSWRTQIRNQPLKDYLRRRGHEYPGLFEFAFLNKTSGAEIDAEALLRELAQLWSEHLDRPVPLDNLVRLVKRYSNESLALKGDQGMDQVFKRARAIVAQYGV